MIAQQVQKKAPELISTKFVRIQSTDATTTRLLEVKYGDLTFALISAVKELKAENDDLRRDVDNLKEARPR